MRGNEGQCGIIRSNKYPRFVAPTLLDFGVEGPEEHRMPHHQAIEIDYRDMQAPCSRPIRCNRCGMAGA